MKTIRDILFILLICCPLSLAAQSNSVFPSWIGDVTDNDLWLGVSQPMAEKEVARNVAIQNAVLYYLCANGGGDVAVKQAAKEETVHVNSDMTKGYGIYQQNECNSFFDESVSLMFTDFSVKVVREYYNKRGEYFVACRVIEVDESYELMTISRKWNETNGSGNMECVISSGIDGKILESHLKVCYDENAITYSYSLVDAANSKDIMLDKSYGYSKCNFTDMPNTYGYNFDINQSLGMSQMMCLAMSPFVAETVSVAVNSIAEWSENKEVMNSSQLTQATGKSQGLGLTFCGVNKKMLSVAVNDQSSKMEGWEFCGDERYTYGLGYSDTQNNRPLALAKIKAYYNAVCDMALHTSVPSEHSNMSTYTELVNKPTNMSSLCKTEKFVDYDIDWGYQNIEKSSSVYVKVGQDTREKLIEELEKQIEEYVHEHMNSLMN